ncbi:hypothetical protein Cme02nite_45050 [Catellatospora methionotrophica]|uniref:Uncharacterized protein n=1 Tax=Catellatospora methionotrophica TaxID=121620 RepID=A0A8J3PH93_9ACTN|nr:hypothetical protein [Catellatospora methionotrophica]GIG16173.1 hypothetical protein Cme02nite_45050 [Catellatospora methionotrophica]
MSARTPSERALIARIAAATRWAKEPSRTEATKAARNAFASKFEQEVDPEGVLAPAERAKRAASLRSAYYSRLALRSAQARRGRRGGAKAA